MLIEFLFKNFNVTNYALEIIFNYYGDSSYWENSKQILFHSQKMRELKINDLKCILAS